MNALVLEQMVNTVYLWGAIPDVRVVSQAEYNLLMKERANKDGTD